MVILYHQADLDMFATLPQAVDGVEAGGSVAYRVDGYVHAFA